MTLKKVSVLGVNCFFLDPTWFQIAKGITFILSVALLDASILDGVAVHLFAIL